LAYQQFPHRPIAGQRPSARDVDTTAFRVEGGVMLRRSEGHRAQLLPAQGCEQPESLLVPRHQIVRMMGERHLRDRRRSLESRLSNPVPVGPLVYLAVAVLLSPGDPVAPRGHRHDDLIPEEPEDGHDPPDERHVVETSVIDRPGLDQTVVGTAENGPVVPVVLEAPYITGDTSDTDFRPVPLPSPVRRYALFRRSIDVPALDLHRGCTRKQ